MELKTTYLLEASLETLHFETTEWAEEIKFYLDELKLFRDMISNKKGRNALETQIISDVELSIASMLNEISKGIIKDLSAHEKYLSGILSNTILVNDFEYREKHKQISKEIRMLKKKVVHVKTRIYRIFKKDQFRYRHQF